MYTSSGHSAALIAGGRGHRQDRGQRRGQRLHNEPPSADVTPARLRELAADAEALADRITAALAGQPGWPGARPPQRHARRLQRALAQARCSQAHGQVDLHARVMAVRIRGAALDEARTSETRPAGVDDQSRMESRESTQGPARSRSCCRQAQKLAYRMTNLPARRCYCPTPRSRPDRAERAQTARTAWLRRVISAMGRLPKYHSE